MSKQYRIVTALDMYGDPVFHVQYRDRWIWTTVLEGNLWHAHDREWGTQNEAEKYIGMRIARDEREAELKKKHKEFKSKVVYGPFPP